MWLQRRRENDGLKEKVASFLIIIFFVFMPCIFQIVRKHVAFLIRKKAINVTLNVFKNQHEYFGSTPLFEGDGQEGTGS